MKTWVERVDVVLMKVFKIQFSQIIAKIVNNEDSKNAGG